MILKLHKCRTSGCPEDSHAWEYKRLSLQELLTVQEVIGLEPAQFEAALSSATSGITGDGVRAVIMLVCLLHKRDGIVVAYAETDLDLQDLEAVPDPAPPAPSEPETAGPGEGKDDGSTTTPSPRHAAPEPGSGNGHAEGSAPRSSTTPPTSGAPMASPL
jgi:hypothetical protein